MDDRDESLTAHLSALRSTLIHCLIALGMMFVPMFFAAPYCINTLIDVIIGDSRISLNYFSPMEVFLLQMKTAAVLDFLVCFPYIARQIWLFILPALYENERRFIRNVVLVSSILFVVGAAFCIAFIMPLIISFGVSFATTDIKAVFGISNIVNLALTMSVVFGVMFQFPLVTCALIKSGIVSYDTIKNKRSYIFVIILIVAGILTPPDVVSQLMLTIPTYLLFEAGLFFARQKKS